ncbi:hypothetical protein RhiirC2_706683 [Rhizophagus irregularis]|uniref:Uncharacterized protein n=1 Tax=Rhizophagus irregularis TaxID=588596 RepID=A0A2N1NTU6_9GLOM|nr:hypothetical protein RhiirC2_706683 [Rhizophagus irregularis]
MTELSPLASQFVPTLQKLSEEILQEIRFLTVVAKVNATVQYRIIRKKFKTRIFQMDLYNAIDKFRREAMPGQNPQSWARAFTNKYFTAGVESTFRSEGENSTLKWLFRNSSLSLCELFDALEERENHILPSQFPSSDSIDAIQMELSQIGDIEVSKIISKKRKFGELFGLGRKIISDVIEDGDEETYNEVLNFLQSIQQRRQRIFHNNNNVNVNIVGIQNPVA